MISLAKLPFPLDGLARRLDELAARLDKQDRNFAQLRTEPRDPVETLLPKSIGEPLLADGSVTRDTLSAGLIQTAREAYVAIAITTVGITWDTAFPDTNYTVNAAATTSADSITVTNITAAGCDVVLGNPASDGTVHATAIHD